MFKPLSEFFFSTVKHFNLAVEFKILNLLILDKESRRSKQSPISSRSSSTSSKSSLGEKLNVRTTHKVIVWGTVDVGKSISKTFDVRSEEHFNIPAHVYVEEQVDSFKVM